MTYSHIEVKIIKAAQNTFLRYGFHGTRIQRIALKAEVSKPTIHYYFRSKEKLYSVVVKLTIDDFLNIGRFINSDEVGVEQQKWFLYTEMYNNQKLFEKSLNDIYPNDWNIKLTEIKEILRI